MKNILKISLILLMILVVTGCSKEYLDPVPETSLGELTPLIPKNGLLGQVNGMYALMKSGALPWWKIPCL